MQWGQAHILTMIHTVDVFNYHLTPYVSELLHTSSAHSLQLTSNFPTYLSFTERQVTRSKLDRMETERTCPALSRACKSYCELIMKTFLQLYRAETLHTIQQNINMYKFCEYETLKTCTQHQILFGE
jgi:hypothetical protein